MIELPVQYNGINLSQYNRQDRPEWYRNFVKDGNTLTVDLFPLTAIIDISDPTNFYNAPMYFYFGMTDKTTFLSNGTLIPLSPDTNFEMLTPCLWSSRFKEYEITPASNGETITTISTIGFDNENLIQIYAGADNFPYTSDDIIVYAPNFGERIYVNTQVEYI